MIEFGMPPVVDLVRERECLDRDVKILRQDLGIIERTQSLNVTKSFADRLHRDGKAVSYCLRATTPHYKNAEKRLSGAPYIDKVLFFDGKKTEAYVVLEYNPELSIADGGKPVISGCDFIRITPQVDGVMLLSGKESLLDNRIVTDIFQTVPILQSESFGFSFRRSLQMLYDANPAHVRFPPVLQ